MPKGVTLFVGYPAVSVCMVSSMHHNMSIKWLVGSNFTFDICMACVLYIFLLVTHIWLNHVKSLVYSHLQRCWCPMTHDPVPCQVILALRHPDGGGATPSGHIAAGDILLVEARCWCPLVLTLLMYVYICIPSPSMCGLGLFKMIFYFPNGQSTIWGIYSDCFLFFGNLLSKSKVGKPSILRENLQL